MVDKGKVVEYGTFRALLAKNGLMAKLVSDNVQIVSESDHLSDTQLETKAHNIKSTDVNTVLDQNKSSLIKALEKTRQSIVSASDSIDVVIPSDAEPMKLVLEDQSVNYKISPGLLYLKAGWGLIITLLIYGFFFLVYAFRVGTGI